MRRHEGVCGQRYKLIRFYGLGVPDGEEWELYDRERDPQEVHNEYKNPEYAQIVEKLKTELQNLRTQYQVVDIAPQNVKKKRKRGKENPISHLRQ